MFASPHELMFFMFSIIVVVLANNEKHTLPVKKHANTKARTRRMEFILAMEEKVSL
jgi:hypothetical protein